MEVQQEDYIAEDDDVVDDDSLHKVLRVCSNKDRDEVMVDTEQFLRRLTMAVRRVDINSFVVFRGLAPPVSR